MNVEENIIFAGRYREIEEKEEHFKDIVDFLDLQDLVGTFYF